MPRLALLLLLAGCAPIGEQTGITLKAAMVSTTDALSAAQKEVAKVGLTGFLPCDVTATFGIVSANNGSLGITSKTAPIINFGAQSDNTLTNTIVVDFKSQACIDMMAHQTVKQ